MTTKTCTKCNITKPLSKFYSHKKCRLGVRPECKECHNKTTGKWYQEHRKQALDWQKQYASTSVGKIVNKKAAKRYRRKPGVKGKISAQKAVAYAVKIGKLPHVTTQTCIRCHKPANHYHHHNGYDAQHKLDVVPVCYRCHRFFTDAGQ